MTAPSTNVAKTSQVKNFSDRIPQYRAVSWWLYWDDMIYPDKNIEEKIIKRANLLHDSGANLAIIFGAHFRWDFIYIWDRLHELMQFIAAALHERDILLFDHHSANLVHRPKSMERKWFIYNRTKHHVSLYPSPEMARELSYNGHKLDEFRMQSIPTGEPCHIQRYDSDVFCMNNPHFKAAYLKYAKKLVTETGIDGLMCDDVIYYSGWDACGCTHCRQKFHKRYGHRLPKATDSSFWGNYESDAFKDWIEMRYNDSADFLHGVRKTLGKNFPLMTCCSLSAAKSADAYGCNHHILSKATNHAMMEMCGELPEKAYGPNGYMTKIPDLLLHLGICARTGTPHIGLGYGHYSDPASFIWGFNKLVGSMSWVSTHKGKVSTIDAQPELAPDDSEIVQKPYLFEKNHADLFKGTRMAKTAVYYSFETQMSYGDSEDDYATSYRRLVTTLFENNIQFDVVDAIPAPKTYPVLVLADITCMSNALQNSIMTYLGRGGTVIGAGPLGLRDERGHRQKTGFLTRFAIQADITEHPRSYNPALFFESDAEPVKQKTAQSCQATYAGKNITPTEWVTIKEKSGRFFWTPGRCLTKKTIAAVMNMIQERQGDCGSIVQCPPGWFYRMYRQNNTILVHGLGCNFTPIAHETYAYKAKALKRMLVAKLDYHGNNGMCVIQTPSRKARLYSPDLREPRAGQIEKGTVSFPLDGIQRYFIACLG